MSRIDDQIAIGMAVEQFPDENQGASFVSIRRDHGAAAANRHKTA